MARWIEGMLRHPRAVIAGAVLLSLLGALGITRIEIDDRLEALLPPDMESLVVWHEIEEIFGTTEPIVVAAGREGASIWDPTTLRTVDQLRARLEELPEVDSVTGITNANHLIASDFGFEVGPLLEMERLEEPGYLQAARGALGGNEMLQALVSEDEAYTLLLVTLRVDADEVAAGPAIQRVIDTLEPELDVHVAGTPFFLGVIAEEIRGDVLSLVRFVFLVLFLVVLLSLRSLKGALLTMAVIALTAMTTLGLMGWTGNKFTVANTSMPIVLLAIASADSIHIITHFLRRLRARGDAREAAAETVRHLMLPVLLTSVTTALAFLSLIGSPITVLGPYGYLTAIGVGWAWVLSATFLPCLLSISRWPAHGAVRGGQAALRTFWSRLAGVVIRRRVAITGIATLLVVASALGVPRVLVEVSMTSMLSPESTLRQASSFLDERFSAGSNLSLLVTGDLYDPALLEDMLDVEAFIEGEEGVGHARSIADLVASMNKAFNGEDPAFERIPETREAVAQLLLLYSFSGDPADLERFVTTGYDRAQISVQMESLSTQRVSRMVDDLKRYLEAEKPGLRAAPTGFAVFLRDLVPLVVRSSVTSVIVALIIMVLVAGIAFRSARLGILTVVPLGATVVLLFGIMGWTGIPLSHVNALMAAIAIGVGVDYAIHFVAAYQRQGNAGRRREERVTGALMEVGPPVAFNALSVGGGFAVLLASRFVPISFLGGLVTFAMIVSALGALILIPSLLLMGREKAATRPVPSDAERPVSE
ncbi:efflux RND transporter permease subunit [Limnochorda pilosa]|uniref:SSD domain-containing protein n=1 Tax=Limnochorda pilosa TaxID=1555112 RepID=A0A0K2SJK7_LIMPI|nr:MMPL family transporter [Limnochorda pilosa]BAS27296.1 hypothetical protein LIP_1447 [Limnochorda pilosa]